MLKILLITFDFSESAMAASYRVRKFAKFLTRLGHDVTVVCRASPNNSETDSELSRCKIISIPFRQAQNTRLLNKIFIRLIALPDPSALWARDAYHKVVSEVNEVDFIFVSSPPHAVQKLGILLSGTLKVPYVADFRDDFLTNHRAKWRTPLHKFVAHNLERKVFETASLVIANTSIIQERFQKRFPNFASKITTIPNGYDEDEFLKIEASFKSEVKSKKRIVYSGGDYNGFAPTVIENIARQLSDKRSGLREEWEIHTAGPGVWHKESDNYGFWCHHGLLSPQDTNRLMLSADILILLMPPGEREPSGTVPLKTYSYLRSGKAIVYFGEKGSTTDLLSTFEGTFSFHRNQMNKFGDWLVDCQQDVQDVSYGRESDLSNYAFDTLTNKILSEVLIILQNKIEVREHNYE